MFSLKEVKAFLAAKDCGALVAASIYEPFTDSLRYIALYANIDAALSKLHATDFINPALKPSIAKGKRARAEYEVVSDGDSLDASGKVAVEFTASKRVRPASPLNAAESSTVGKEGNTLTSESGLLLCNTPGDGNCFFHAVERQLEKIGSTLSHTALRQEAVTYVRAHIAAFEEFIAGERPEAYINRMQTNGEWADHVIIKALALSLRVKIVILQLTESGAFNAPVVIMPDCPEASTIFLYHILERHYQSVEGFNAAILNSGFHKIYHRLVGTKND